jgi:hypothetical protein
MKLLGKGILGLGKGIGKGTKMLYESTKEGVGAIKEYNSFRKYMKDYNEEGSFEEKARNYLPTNFPKTESDASSYLTLLDKMYTDGKISRKKHEKLKNTLYKKTIDAIEEYNSPENQINRFWRKISAAILSVAGFSFFISNIQMTGNVIGTNFGIENNLIGIFLLFSSFLIYPKRKIIKRELNSLSNKQQP